MFRRRGGRATGSYTRRSTTLLKGLFSDGIWQCECRPRVPAERFQVKKDTKNKNRWFYTCQRPESERCGFFLWEDDAKPREEGAVLNNSRTEPGAAKIHGAQSPPPPYSIHGNSNHEKRPVLKALDKPAVESDDELAFGISSGDEIALSQVADAILCETPKKAVKTHSFTTPGKRKFSDMAVGGLPTPNTNRSPLFASRGAGSISRITDDFLDVVSPHTTPTPSRVKNALPSVESSDDIFSNITGALAASNVALNDNAETAVERVCNRYALKNRGLVQARDITRKALVAKDSLISELEHRIKTLEAELDTERAVISYLRAEKAGEEPD